MLVGILHNPFRCRCQCFTWFVIFVKSWCIKHNDKHMTQYILLYHDYFDNRKWDSILSKIKNIEQFKQIDKSFLWFLRFNSRNNSESR